MFLQLFINGLIMGSIYSLVALGYALVYNTTKIFHIAYTVLYTFSSYIFLTFFRNLGMNLFISVFISLIITAFLSIFIELLIYRPLVKKKSSLNIIMISSIGAMIIVINLIALFYGNETKVLNPNISKSISFSNIIITYSQLAQLVVSIFVIILFMFILKKTSFGIKTRAMSDNPLLCSVFGMNLLKFRIFLFGLSGLFAAIGGLLVSYDVGMDPYVGMPMLLNAVVALIIGGVGKFEGAILGGVILGVTQSLAVWAFSSRWQNAVTFILLVIFLLVRPQGILGEKHRRV